VRPRGLTGAKKIIILVAGQDGKRGLEVSGQFQRSVFGCRAALRREWRDQTWPPNISPAENRACPPESTIDFFWPAAFDEESERLALHPSLKLFRARWTPAESPFPGKRPLRPKERGRAGRVEHGLTHGAKGGTT